MKKEIKKQIAKKEKKLIDYTWVVKITLMAFIISMVFSLISESTISNVNIFVSIIILIIFIIIGIIFDMIGVAVTSSDEQPFHSMSSRRIKGAKTAVKLKKNADKTSSFCNDVIGDICGIISGAVGASIASSISLKFNIPIFISSLFITALIASLTIGGKAIFKSIAINKSNEILYEFAKVIDFFIK
jgi:CBS domain containing-hemolysin-like protein